MKNITKYLVSSVLLSSLLFAGGGNTEANTDVEPIVAIPEAPTTIFYLGAAFANIHNGISGDGYSLIAGVPLMENLAIEARYASVESDNDHDITNTVLFLKPKMMVADSLCIYGLLGYGQVDYVGVKDEGLEYGAGMAFHFNDNIALFADYIQTKAIEDVKLHGFTTGLVYKF
jgi:opacity protein-like surface antigen